MSGSEFLVRRPLPEKEGFLVVQDEDGSISSKVVSLSWPQLSIGDDKVDCLRGSQVCARPEKDGVVNGSQSFCIELVPRVARLDGNGGNILLYASTAADRTDWAKKLRKHAVHHDIDNGFDVSQKVLGTGAYATVYLATDRATQEKVALKIILKTRLDYEERSLLAEEVRISQEATHRFCIKTFEFIEAADRYILVMEYVGGGELFERLLYHKYSEAEVQIITKQLLAGLAYLHSRHICHRDLKPENFLLTSERPMTIKIADYGIAVDVKPTNRDLCLKDGPQLRCSPGYGAPEIVQSKSYGLPCDMWSMGVVVYLLLTGKQPFNGKTPVETRKLMNDGIYDHRPLAGCSMIAGDLVARMLDRDPSKRISAEKALLHPWIAKPNENSDGADLPPKASCCGLFGAKKDPRTTTFTDPSIRSMAVPKNTGPSCDISVRQSFFQVADLSGRGGGKDSSDHSVAGGAVLERSDTGGFMTTPQSRTSQKNAQQVEGAFAI